MNAKDAYLEFMQVKQHTDILDVGNVIHHKNAIKANMERLEKHLFHLAVKEGKKKKEKKNENS